MRAMSDKFSIAVGSARPLTASHSIAQPGASRFGFNEIFPLAKGHSSRSLTLQNSRKS